MFTLPKLLTVAANLAIIIIIHVRVLSASTCRIIMLVYQCDCAGGATYMYM